jgi:hypothetical protein
MNLFLGDYIMSINTKVRFVLLSSAVALAAATAPAFAGDAGTWQGDFYTAAGGTPDAPAATYSRQVMDKQVEQSGETAAGTWQGDFYTLAGGTPEAPAATYSKQVLDKIVVDSTPIQLASLSSAPRY